MKKIIVPLANGFEELEAITVIDVLKRANLEVEIIALDDLEVESSNQVLVKADKKLKEIKKKDLAGMILPGGMPGAKNLKNTSKIIEITQYLANKNALVAAICAAPIVLSEAGVIFDKKVTSYPGFEEELNAKQYLEERVVIDQNIITARGPGVALEFAISIIEYLKDEDEANKIKDAMLTNF